MTDKQDQFQQWLAEMDDALDSFFASLPKELGRKRPSTFSAYSRSPRVARMVA